MERLRLELEHALDDVTRRAYALAGADVGRIAPPQPMSVTDKPVAPGVKLKFYARAMSLARPVAPLVLGHRERRGKEDAQRRRERLGVPSLPRPDGPLVWFHAASVGETNAVLPVIHSLLERARRSVGAADLGHGDVGRPRRQPPAAARNPSVCAARRARIRPLVPRPLAARSRGVHRKRDLAQSHSRNRSRRTPLGAGQRAHVVEKFPALAEAARCFPATVLAVPIDPGPERAAGAALLGTRRTRCACGRQPQDRLAPTARRCRRPRAAGSRHRRPATVRRRQHACGRGNHPGRSAPHPGTRIRGPDHD